MSFALAAFGGYLLGSIPFGLVLVRLAGLGDIRDIGSGNIGATNVLRTGRKDLALATLVLDSGKAGAAVLIARAAGFSAEAAAVAGFAAFLGHCFPVWLGFRGGKGVATFLGALLALAFLPALMVCATWLLIAFAARISSLAALVAAAGAPLYLWLAGEQAATLAALGMTGVIYFRHQDNIRRLIAGTEPRIGAKKD